MWYNSEGRSLKKMSENIMLYDGEQKRIDTKLKDSLIMVQEYRNKTYEDKTKDCRNVFEKAKKHRDERLAYYENKPKEYKAIKRYGHVLEKVERLLGIIPEPKKEFKLEDLASKMKELITARTKVTVIDISITPAVLNNPYFLYFKFNS